MFEENYQFHVVKEKMKKVIIDSDVRNEVDDPFAIMLALMTPMLDVRGVIATHFGHDRIQDSAQASYDYLQELLEKAGLTGKVSIALGSSTRLKTGDEPGFFGSRAAKPYHNDGVDMILREVHALAPGEKLYIAVMGPMTDVACAYLIDPSIANRIVVVWNGGADYPHGGMEFNLVNDILAANIIFSSNVEVWQIPTYTYGLPRASFAEMQLKVYPCGELGRWLFKEVIDFCDLMKDNPGWPLPESLDICDLTTIGVLMEEHIGYFEYRQAPYIDQEMFYHESGNRPIRVYTSVNYRYILDDLFAKLEINYKK